MENGDKANEDHVPVKRKRGRPRKVDVAQAQAADSAAEVEAAAPAAADNAVEDTPQPKRKRGRPPGSKNKNRLAAESVAEAAPAKLVPATTALADPNGEPGVKRKRGRPPKVRPADGTSAPAAPPAAPPAAVPAPAPAAAPAAADAGSSPVVKRRGRPPGSKNKGSQASPLTPPQAAPAQLTRNIGAVTPYVLTVAPEEDVGEKLRDLSRTLRRSLVLLAAHGTLSAATLMQVTTGGAGVGVTLRGHFTILSLSGALLQAPLSAAEARHSSRSEPRDPHQIFLSASLANPSGGVVGGTVAGPLEAAAPVTVVLGHWEPEHRNSSTAAAAAKEAEGDADGAQFAAAGPLAMVGRLSGGALSGGAGLHVAAAAVQGAAGGMTNKNDNGNLNGYNNEGLRQEDFHDVEDQHDNAQGDDNGVDS